MSEQKYISGIAVLALIFSHFLSAQAKADVLTITALGQVTHVEDYFANAPTVLPFDIGDPFHVTYSIDTNTPGVSPPPPQPYDGTLTYDSTSQYHGGVYSFNIGTYQSTEVGISTGLVVADNGQRTTGSGYQYSFDTYSVYATNVYGPVNASDIGSMQFGGVSAGLQKIVDGISSVNMLSGSNMLPVPSVTQASDPNFEAYWYGRDASGNITSALDVYGELTSWSYTISSTATPPPIPTPPTPPTPPPPAPANQKVFLDFGETQIDLLAFQFLNNLKQSTTSVTSPDSGLLDHQKAIVLNQLEAIYADYNIDFYLAPPSGEFSTIFFGGTADGVLHGKPELLGLAQQLDFGNQDRTDVGLVFTDDEEFDQYFQFGSDAPYQAIGNAAAHEIGHILGLVHVQPNPNLMYESGVSSGLINHTTQNIVGLIPGVQNSDMALGRNIGFSDPNIAVTSDGQIGSRIKAFLTWAGSTFLTIYDALVGLIYSPDVLPTVLPLGDINSGELLSIQLPIGTEGFEFFFVGKSKEDGLYDIFSSPFSAEFLNGSILSTDIDYSLLAYNADFTRPLSLDLIYTSGEDRFAIVGSVDANLSLQRVPVPSPTSFLIVGLLTLLTFRVVRTRKPDWRTFDARS